MQRKSGDKINGKSIRLRVSSPDEVTCWIVRSYQNNSEHEQVEYQRVGGSNPAWLSRRAVGIGYGILVCLEICTLAYILENIFAQYVDICATNLITNVPIEHRHQVRRRVSKVLHRERQRPVRSGSEGSILQNLISAPPQKKNQFCS
jgi:hypothetical protein